METRKETEQEDFTPYIINELSAMEITRALKFLEHYWKTDDYRALKEKLMTQPDTLSPDELICFVLARDGEETPYEIPLECLQQAIAEKKETLPKETLNHLMIIEKILAQKILDNEEHLTKESRNLLWDRHKNGTPFLNLAKVDLSHLHFQEIPLNGACLVRANLQNIKFASFRLDNSNLSYADLRGADLGCANLNNINLQMSNLENAQLWSAQLTHVDLSHANLTNVNFKSAKLKNVNLQKAVFSKNDMTNTQFKAQTQFFSPATSLEELKTEFMLLMHIMADCTTFTRSFRKDNAEIDFSLTINEFEDTLYVGIAKDLVRKLAAMTDITREEKRAFIDQISPCFEPVSLASNIELATGLLFDFGKFLDQLLSKDLHRARFFGLADPRTKSQAVLYQARKKMDAEEENHELGSVTCSLQ